MKLIKGGRVIDPKTKTDAILDILVEGPRILKIGKDLPVGDAELYSAEGQVVCPGLVDVHVHFRDPGLTYKEDVFSGARSAARGGFTSVVCMANTKPPMDCPETLQQLLNRAAQAIIHVYTVATASKGLRGQEHTDMVALKEGGCVGFSDDGIPLMDTAFLRETMARCKELNLPLSLHEEDPRLITNPGFHAGEAAQKLGLVGAPSVSESSMIARDMMLALDTGAHVHMQHLSCKESVQLLRFAKAMGARVTGEVTPQHLFLTQEALLDQGALAKVNPPLRTEEDRQALIQGLKEGVIDCIATDHAPHSREEKSTEGKAIAKTPSGLIGLETALGLCISSLVKPGHLTLPQMLEKMTYRPAQLYGLKAGYLAEGETADITILDPDREWQVPDHFVSKASNSPFIGQKLTGKVLATMCDGKWVYESKVDE